MEEVRSWRYARASRSLAFLVVFVALAGPARASDLFLYLPLPPGLAWEEAQRLQPGAQLEQYAEIRRGSSGFVVVLPDGSKVARPAEAVVVFLAEDLPPYLPKATLAATDYQNRLVVVFPRQVERALGEGGRRSPLFAIALGRLIAHEAEHARRQTSDHDRSGFFQKCLSRQELIAIGWGR